MAGKSPLFFASLPHPFSRGPSGDKRPKRLTRPRLGWNDNLEPGAEELAAVYKSAGNPSQFRGIATNVAGWNSWDATPGEFAGDTDAQWNKCQNEKLFVEIFGEALASAGMPNHAIVDTGRNGVQGNREEWGSKWPPLPVLGPFALLFYLFFSLCPFTLSLPSPYPSHP